MVKTIIVLAGWLLVAWLTAQAFWVVLRHWLKFHKYWQMFTTAEKRFNDAMAQSESAARRLDYEEATRLLGVCGQIVVEQRHYLRAQRAIMRDNFIPPWRWPERWNADYLKETEKAA